MLSLLSIPQKAALGADPFAPTGFVVPILFGGLSSLCIAFAVLRFQEEQARRHRQRLESEQSRSGLERLLLQKRKLEALGRMAGGVAHDFNNILQAIMSSTDLLSAELAAGGASPAEIEAIKSAAQAGAELTRQLLEFGRTEPNERRRLQPETLVSRTVELLKRLLGEDIDLQIRLRPDLWPVRVDPTQFEQVLMNLALNGRDAMHGKGALKIQLGNVELDGVSCSICSERLYGDHVRLLVQDEGEGMDAITREQIFDPFFTTKELGRGTGLGLATVLGAVQQNQGHIVVDSAPDKGTSMEVFFPRTGVSTEDASGPADP